MGWLFERKRMQNFKDWLVFAPEGYLTWAEMLQASGDWTLEVVVASLAPELTIEQVENNPYRCRRVICDKLVASNRVENLREAEFAMGLLELWVLANFMDMYDAVLCSPNGVTLRCPPLLKAHGDAFDWWSWPLSNEKLSSHETSSYFDAFRKGVFDIGHAHARFCAIDYSTGTIRLKPNTIRLLLSASYGHGSTKEELLRFVDEQIRPIVGWSICWNPSEIPKNKKGLYESLGFGDLDWTALGESTTKGRFGKTDRKHILECVTTAFPHGKGNATWPSVEAKVGYSRRSIIRALRQNGQYADWASSGQSE